MQFQDLDSLDFDSIRGLNSEKIIYKEQNIIINKNTTYFYKAFEDNFSDIKIGEKIIKAILDNKLPKLQELQKKYKTLNLEINIKYLLTSELKSLDLEYRNDITRIKTINFISKKDMLTYPDINYLPICSVDFTENLTEEQLWNYKTGGSNCLLIDSSLLPQEVRILDYSNIKEEEKTIEVANGQININNKIIDLKDIKEAYYFGGDIIVEVKEEE